MAAAHVHWGAFGQHTQEVDVLVCKVCGTGRLKSKLEALPGHVCGDTWAYVTEPQARNAMLRILSGTLRLGPK